MQVKFGKLDEIDYTRREALNSLQTNLSFCGDDNKVILVTSTVPDEGKSSLVMQLGIEMASDGRKVLIIDADLRKSVLVGRYFVKSDSGEIKGLSHYLSGQIAMKDAIAKTNIDNFDIVFAGHITPKPTEMLRNEYFKSLIKYAKENYDIVLIDAPPLGIVIDAAVVATVVDGAMLVIEAENCSYKQITGVKKQLEKTGVNILGAVISKAPVEKGKYYSKYYGKYGEY